MTITVWLDSPSLDPASVRVAHAECSEELSTPYEVRVDLVGTPGARLDDLELMGAPAALVIQRDRAEVRRIAGVVTRVTGSAHAESGSLQQKMIQESNKDHNKGYEAFGGDQFKESSGEGSDALKEWADAPEEQP